MGADVQYVLTTQRLILVFFEKPKQTILFLCHYPKNHYFCYHIIIKRNNNPLMRKITNPFAGMEGFHCFGCCKDNDHGVHMDFYEDGDDVVCRKLQIMGVTSKLELSYRRPVLTTDSQITLRGHITEQKRNLAFVDLTLENSKGEVCTTARAIYYLFTQEKSQENGFTGCGTEDEELLF